LLACLPAEVRDSGRKRVYQFHHLSLLLPKEKPSNFALKKRARIKRFYFDTCFSLSFFL